MNDDCDGAATDARRPAGACRACGKTARIVAKGLCRPCYDHERFCGDPSWRVRNAKKLGADARAVLRAAIAHRKRTGCAPGLNELQAEMQGWSCGRVWAGAHEAIRCGSALYGLLPVYQERARKRAKAVQGVNEITAKSNETVRETSPETIDISDTSHDVGKCSP